MRVQIFGTKKSADTRKALRFFSDRRVNTHFVDFKVRSASPGELKRFAQRFGVDALIDREGKLFADRGLRHARLTDDQWLARLSDDPALLRQPLVRLDNQLSVGLAESEWKKWVGNVE
jgi:arsenate reductase-like glutaredoxin family protein